MGAGTPSLPLMCRRRPTAAVPTREEGGALAKRVGRRVQCAQLVASAIGAFDVFALLWLVLPYPEHPGVSNHTLFIVNAVLFVVLLPLGALVGVRWGAAWFGPMKRWLVEGRAPTSAERYATLRAPLRASIISGSGWLAGAAVFGVVNAAFSPAVGWHVASTIVTGGVTSVAIGYLLSERLMRPLTARVLAFGPIGPLRPGVKGRLVLTWVAATGVPLIGLLSLGSDVLSDYDRASVDQLARSMVVLSALTIVAGLVATVLAAKSIAEPLTAVRRALARIEEGDLAARVAVDDGSEIGLVQSRVNTMAAGLEERERLRDLFGRHVGPDVVREALDGDGDAVRLGGEVRDVAVLFVDLVGSTSLAATRPPDEVVRLLNAFFAVVVDVVGRHGGWVNKFEGDAALAVFGAPVDHPDAAGAALAAARDLHAVLPLDAGIGVSAGPAVAGNIGAEERFEYTVIGDPVNEAARLCDLAKRRPDRVLASGVAIERAQSGEGSHWDGRDEAVLRGRSEPTLIAAPVALRAPVE